MRAQMRSLTIIFFDEGLKKLTPGKKVAKYIFKGNKWKFSRNICKLMG